MKMVYIEKDFPLFFCLFRGRMEVLAAHAQVRTGSL